jgi:5-methylcytosine-specific restriction protein A
MADKWFIFAPERGGAAQRFEIGMEKGTWGAKTPGNFGGLTDGDTVVFAHGVKAGTKRVPRGFPEKNLMRGQPRLSRVVRTKVVGHQYLGTSPIWPDDPYMFRFDFKVVSQATDVVLFGGEIDLTEAYAIWHSLRSRGKAFEPTEDSPEVGPARPRNLRWGREELLMALDVARTRRKSTLFPTHPAILELSNLLRKHKALLATVRPPAHRNLKDVFVKVQQFLALDPEFKGKSLPGAGRAEEDLWEEYSDDRAGLTRDVGALRVRILKGLKGDEALLDIDGEAEGVGEGRLLFRAHRSRERDREAVTKARKRAIRKHRKLSCEVCDFSFTKRYGARGAGFLEAHHRVPISEVAPGAKTRVQDLALLCANCHRMIHRRWPTLTVEGLREIVEKRR